MFIICVTTTSLYVLIESDNIKMEVKPGMDQQNKTEGTASHVLCVRIKYHK